MFLNPNTFVVQVRGEVHHDRRLHQLMLQEELRLYAAANEQASLQESVSGLSGSPDSLHSDLAAAASSDSADSVPCDYRCGCAQICTA